MPDSADPIFDPIFLLASPDPALLAIVEPVLRQAGARVEIVLSAEAAIAAMTGPNVPRLALLDANLPGMRMEEILARARTGDDGKRFPILLVSDAVTHEWIDRLASGAIDDLIPRTAESSYWRLRIDVALRAFRLAHEAKTLNEAAVLNAQLDRLTGVYNRQALLAILFRETDRVQRLNSAMSLVLFDLDDFGHWNSRLGIEACDVLLCQVAERTVPLMRSYDVVGRPGMDEFLIGLPGCDLDSAVRIAERLRTDVFGVPFHVKGESIRLSACFGIAPSNGRSPVVVLREAEQALLKAKTAGPESIQCAGEWMRPDAAPVAFLLPSSGEELIAW